MRQSCYDANMNFQTLTLDQRPLLQAMLRAISPRTSELNFTNLFIWRRHFDTRWCIEGETLLLAFAGPDPSRPRALEPVGPGARLGMAEALVEHLSHWGSETPRLVRLGAALATELSGAGWRVEETRDHHDYVYAQSDLAGLVGKKYNAKRNHLNRIRREHRFVSRPYTADDEKACLELAERWCDVRACSEDMSLGGEWEAVRDLIEHREELELSGWVIELEEGIRAFSFADALNDDTAVVHVEKADPELPELYTLINQQFAEKGLNQFTWINREQDLGEVGLRRAKESYRPQRLELKHEATTD